MSNEQNTALLREINARAVLRQFGGDDMFAGDKMVIETTEDGGFKMTFDDKGTGRVCGDCTLCCKLVPVPTIAKAAGQRCRHQSSARGCRIHDTAEFPWSCKIWACRWLADPETRGMPRPDRAHYVIDPVLDYITTTDLQTGEKRQIGVIQVWADPAFPEAAKAPELRAFMKRIAIRFKMPTLIRWSATHAVTIFPPTSDEDDTWVERVADVVARDDLEHQIIAQATGRTTP